jgi:peptidoglycan hydrolase CwlO-like protein
MSLLDDYETLSSQLDIHVYKETLDQFMVPMFQKVTSELADIWEAVRTIRMQLDKLQGDVIDNQGSLVARLDYEINKIETRLNSIEANIKM